MYPRPNSPLMLLEAICTVMINAQLKFVKQTTEISYWLAHCMHSYVVEGLRQQCCKYLVLWFNNTCIWKEKLRKYICTKQGKISEATLRQNLRIQVSVDITKQCLTKLKLLTLQYLSIFISFAFFTSSRKNFTD